MKIKMLKNKWVLPKVILERGTTYEVDSVIVDSYRIKIPMKRQGKFKFALIGEDEGELVDELMVINGNDEALIHIDPETFGKAKIKRA